MIDEFVAKLKSSVERSEAKFRADVAHNKITAMGFAGSGRTTRRAVAEMEKAWRFGTGAGAPAVDPGARDVGVVRLR